MYYRQPFYGYPGIQGKMLPDGGTVTRTSMSEQRPYLCVAYDTEQATVQPLRLAAGLIGGPVVIYAASRLPKDEAMLKAVTTIVGVGMMYWSLWVWNKADTAMKTLPE